MNTCGSWRYIEVLWSETIGLCKKLNIISSIITCNPEPQANGEVQLFSANWFFQPIPFNKLVPITDSFDYQLSDAVMVHSYLKFWTYIIVLP